MTANVLMLSSYHPLADKKAEIRCLLEGTEEEPDSSSDIPASGAQDSRASLESLFR